MFPSITDPITIDGDGDLNGTRAVVALSALPAVVGGVSNARFDIELQNVGGSVTIQNLTVVPNYLGAGALNTALDCAIGIDEANGTGGPYVGATVNFTNCLFTASTTGNVPVDPLAAAPADITRFSGSGGVLGNSHIGWASSPNSGGTTGGAASGVVNITNCRFGHWTSHVAASSRWAVLGSCDSASSGSNTINVTNSLFSKAPNGLGAVNAIGTNGAERLVINVDNTTVTEMGNYGITMGTVTPTRRRS